MLTLACYN